VDTGLVGTLELVEHAGPWSGSADCHIVLVAGITAVGNSIAHLIVLDTFAVPALELVDFVTAEVSTLSRGFITAIPTIVHLITKIIMSDTQMVVTLKLVGGTVGAIEPGLTVEFVREVTAVPVSVTPELLLYTVARVTLPLARRTAMVSTVSLVTAIIAVIVQVTAPP